MNRIRCCVTTKNLLIFNGYRKNSIDIGYTVV